jgi:hypothetical protein
MRSRPLTIGIVVAVIVVIGGFLTISRNDSMPISITYDGFSYTSMVSENIVGVRAHVGSLRRVHDTIDGKAVWISSGSPPSVVALETAPGHWDAYQTPTPN